MSRSLLLALAAFLAAAPALCAQDEPPALDGYVTSPGTLGAFDVNGFHVTCNPSNSGCRVFPYGEHLAIYGKRDKRAHTITADRIEPAKETDTHISGFAMIDGILSATVIRADGYAMEIGPATKKIANTPLAPSDKPAIGDWVQYEGERHAGIVLLKQLALYPPAVPPSEQKLRDKTTFDAAAVTEDDRQSGASKFFKGVDFKRIPAVHDAAQQARIDTIGNKLIPAWQKSLPAGDPNKLEFHFQLVDAKWPDCLAIPTGTILVPATTVAKLEDDELAAVLADNIATVLEKQTFRYLPARPAMTTSAIAGDVAGAFVPGLGLVTAGGNSIAAHSIHKRLEEQSGRVALVLLHDAGFDIRKAPLAWWQLSTRQADYMSKSVPYRAAYLFQLLATDWTGSSVMLSNAM